jgi:hypothetical protein
MFDGIILKTKISLCGYFSSTIIENFKVTKLDLNSSFPYFSTISECVDVSKSIDISGKVKNI